MMHIDTGRVLPIKVQTTYFGILMYVRRNSLDSGTLSIDAIHGCFLSNQKFKNKMIFDIDRSGKNSRDSATIDNMNEGFANQKKTKFFDIERQENYCDSRELCQ